MDHSPTALVLGGLLGLGLLLLLVRSRSRRSIVLVAREADRIAVAVDGETVVLSGNIASWSERQAVIGAARGLPGRNGIARIVAWEVSRAVE